MKLQFKAKGSCPLEYKISGYVVNGIDMSQLPQGGKFIGNDETREAGIYDAVRDETGELVVTLGQRGIGYEVPAQSSDWRGDPQLLIDASDYDPDTCYINATSMPDGAHYVRRDDGWTVAYPEATNE